MERIVADKIIKILKITGNVLIYVFFALSLCLLVLSFISKRDSDGAIKIFGREMLIVKTASMEQNKYTRDTVSRYKIKSIPRYSAVFVELVPKDETKAKDWYNRLNVGDVLTFKYVIASRQETITHRITAIEDKSTGGKLIELRADNGSGSPDSWSAPQIIDTSAKNSFNYVIGKVTGKNFLLGLIVYEIKQPLGSALMIIVPCAILIVFEIINIANVLGASKRKRIDKTAQIQRRT